MASDDQIILFSPVTSAASVPCERMPRNYSRKQILQKWCYKSVLFANKGFHTPSPIGMHLANDGFVFVASKLIRLTATKNLKNEDLNSLLTYLNGLDYWKYLGFEEKPIDEQILTRITTMRAKKKKEANCHNQSLLWLSFCSRMVRIVLWAIKSLHWFLMGSCTLKSKKSTRIESRRGLIFYKIGCLHIVTLSTWSF